MDLVSLFRKGGARSFLPPVKSKYLPCYSKPATTTFSGFKYLATEFTVLLLWDHSLGFWPCLAPSAHRSLFIFMSGCLTLPTLPWKSTFCWHKSLPKRQHYDFGVWGLGKSLSSVNEPSSCTIAPEFCFWDYLSSLNPRQSLAAPVEEGAARALLPEAGSRSRPAATLAGLYLGSPTVHKQFYC